MTCFTLSLSNFTTSVQPPPPHLVYTSFLSPSLYIHSLTKIKAIKFAGYTTTFLLDLTFFNMSMPWPYIAKRSFALLIESLLDNLRTNCVLRVPLHKVSFLSGYIVFKQYFISLHILLRNFRYKRRLYQEAVHISDLDRLRLIRSGISSIVDISSLAI